MNTHSKFIKVTHAISAILIFLLISSGFYMQGIDNIDNMIAMYDWHKSLGVLLIIITLIRLMFVFRSAKPTDATEHGRVEVLIATITKVTFYFLLLSLPLSGWVMTNAAGFDVSFFGLFDLPKLFVDNELTMQLASKTHSILVNAITILLILHILAAAKHHFMDRDNTLRNMFLVNAGNAFYYLILSSAIMLLLTFSWHILTKKEVNHQTHESAHEQAHSQEHGMGDKPHDSLTH